MNTVDRVEEHNITNIARKFGQSTEYYHQHARLQKEVAQRLIASLEPWKDIIPPGPVLETGCGTGFVTKGLTELYPDRDMVITDLSPEMVAFCSNRFKNNDRLSFKPLDAEQIRGDDPLYSLTVCGFAAQWFKDPALGLGRMLEITKPGGLLLASFPGNQSFPEWKDRCMELGLPYTGNTLPDTEEVVVKLSVGPAQVDYYEDTVTETYSDAADFFRHLKNIGAGTRHTGRALTASEMRLLINHWDNSTDGNITVSYHIVFLAVKRDHTA